MTVTQRIIAVSLAFAAGVSPGAPEWDERYAFERLSVVVLNTGAEPIHGEQVEAGLVDRLESQMRFTVVREGAEVLRESFAGNPPPPLGDPGAENLAPFQDVLPRFAALGLHGVVLGELQVREEGYRVFVVLVVPRTGEIIHSAAVPVGNRLQLASFSAAAAEAADKLTKAIPFDGAVVSREGYRVVLNRGFPALYPGQRLPAFTLEQDLGGYAFRETGTILLTRVERSVAFGTVLVERDGRQVARGNKIRLGADTGYEGRFPLAGAKLARAPASLLGGQVTAPKGQLGTMQVDLAASLVNLSVTASGGLGSQSSTHVFPGAHLLGELWLTGRMFLQLGFGFSATTLASGDERLNSNLSDFRGHLGYRLLLTGRRGGPTLHGKAGFASHRLIVDPGQDPLAFGSATYQGLSLGTGADIPLTDRWGMGADIHVLLFPSLDEGPLTSGAVVENTTAIDFSIRTYYNLTDEIDVEGRFNLQGFSAQFSGAGTRPVPLLSASRSVRAFSVGLAYYF